jgi:hypothetical protein
MKPSNTGQQKLFNVEASTPKLKQKQKSEKDYVFDIVDALSAPVLVFSTLWSDIIPKRLFEILPLARMKALMQGEQLATYAECVIYIYPRTLEAPMTSEWVDIYTHISCKTLEEWFGEDHWNEVKAPRELSQWLLSQLGDLRCHLYNKRREILKTRLKSEEKIDAKSKHEKVTETTSIQQSLLPFEF